MYSLFNLRFQFVTNEGIICNHQSHQSESVNILIALRNEEKKKKKLCGRYSSYCPRSSTVQSDKVPLTFRRSGGKNAQKNGVLDQRAQLRREKKRACWFLHFHCLCLAFCPLNALDILRRRSKARERDVGVEVQCRLEQGLAEETCAVFAVVSSADRRYRWVSVLKSVRVEFNDPTINRKCDI